MQCPMDVTRVTLRQQHIFRQVSHSQKLNPDKTSLITFLLKNETLKLTIKFDTRFKIRFSILRYINLFLCEQVGHYYLHKMLFPSFWWIDSDSLTADRRKSFKFNYVELFSIKYPYAEYYSIMYHGWAVKISIKLDLSRLAVRQFDFESNNFARPLWN